MTITNLPGLDQIKTKLEHIHNECNPNPEDKSSKKSVEKDEFLRAKKGCYAMLVNLRERIRHRLELIKKKGNNVEAIKLGVSIQTMISEMEKKLLPNMEAILKKQDSGSYLRKRIKPEEIAERYNDLSVLQKHLQDCKRSHLSNREPAHEDYEEAWAEQEDGAPSTLFGTQVDKTGREMGDDEKTLVDRWAAKDKEFDTLLEGIILDVQELGEHAATIGVAAERHQELIAELTDKTGNASTGVKGLASQAKDIVKQDQNATCCCRIILLVALMIILAFIFAKMTK